MKSQLTTKTVQLLWPTSVCDQTLRLFLEISKEVLKKKAHFLLKMNCKFNALQLGRGTNEAKVGHESIISPFRKILMLMWAYLGRL